MSLLDRSHDPLRVSWVESANGHADFPIQNLPLGVSLQDESASLVVAIGDEALSLGQALDIGWGGFLPEALRHALRASTLNLLAARPATEWTALRLALSDALSDRAWELRLRRMMMPHAGIPMGLPFVIGDYTDFYASIHHATNVGSMFRPDQPLLPNYKWVPIGYHGRASSIVVDGSPVHRPRGQTRAPDAEMPSVGPSKSLDFELEMGFFIGGFNAQGDMIPADEAHTRVFGCCLLNDWSARDLQAWEYQPLGPFLAKNFATTISPWVVTSDALIPFRTPMPPRPQDDPAPLPYLRTSAPDFTYTIHLEAAMRTASMREKDLPPVVVTRVNYADAMYWSPAQLVTHHASGGCDLNPGDLLGSGTVSGTSIDARGCLLERTWRGRDRISLGDESRGFIEDGDEIAFQGRCQAAGAVAIGFGSCRGVVLPA